MKLRRLGVINYKSFADSHEIEFAGINILIGRNNSGKSALIRAAHLIQRGSDYSLRDIRLGTEAAEIQYDLEDPWPGLLSSAGALEVGELVRATVQITPKSPPDNLSTSMGRSQTNFQYISDHEPGNFIYTYLSKRKVTVFDQVVNRDKTNTVSNSLRYLVSKVDRLANPDHPKSQEYSDLCNSVLGFRVSSIASEQGHQAGILVGGVSYIPIEDMGEGVSSLLGLITDLCVADGNLFLIEEPENDIHPEGLKTILRVIAEKSSSNQFIISTHSNIVMKYLGSEPKSKIFNVELQYQPGIIPTSAIVEIGSAPEERMQVLRQLGYEYYDFDLWEGWLILEESSAEIIIRDYLVPWFAPKLSRIRTISANGTGNIEAVFDDFYRLFLFTHLQPQYRGRAWVIADGEESGVKVIQRLATKYASWSPDHFRTWAERDFERYYPSRFASDIDEALSKSGQAKKSAKKSLLSTVKLFCNEHAEEAKRDFQKSASEVISVLQEIETRLFTVLFTSGTMRSPWSVELTTCFVRYGQCVAYRRSPGLAPLPRPSDRCRELAERDHCSRVCGCAATDVLRDAASSY